MKQRQHLGIRKVCAANYSCAINLPKEWTKQNDITPDKRVELILMDDGSLLVRPSKM